MQNIFSFIKNINKLGRRQPVSTWTQGLPFSNAEWNNRLMRREGPKILGKPWFYSNKRYLTNLQPAPNYHCTAMIVLTATSPVDWIQIPCDKRLEGVSYMCTDSSTTASISSGNILTTFPTNTETNMTCFKDTFTINIGK